MPWSSAGPVGRKRSGDMADNGEAPRPATAGASSSAGPVPVAESTPALEVIGADRKWWQVGPFTPKPPTANGAPATTTQTNTMCMGRGKNAPRSFGGMPHARPVRRSFAEPTPEQISQLAAFTNAAPAVCGRILKDCRGDEQAAAQWLLLSGGRETMCVTLPAGQAPGSTMQISTPRGLISVTVPDGLEEGAEFTFSLPEPAAEPNVARHVDGAPSPQATATMAPGAAAPPPGVAQASPPVVVIGGGRPYAYAQPCHGYGYGYGGYYGYGGGYGGRYGGFYDPYPYYDPYYGPYRGYYGGPYGRGYYDPYYYDPCTIM